MYYCFCYFTVCIFVLYLCEFSLSASECRCLCTECLNEVVLFPFHRSKRISDFSVHNKKTFLKSLFVSRSIYLKQAMISLQGMATVVNRSSPSYLLLFELH